MVPSEVLQLPRQLCTLPTFYYILLFLPATPLPITILCVPGWGGGGALVPSEVLQLPHQLCTVYTAYILLFLPATPLLITILCVQNRPGWEGGGTLVPSEVLLPRQLYCTTLLFMPRRLPHLCFLLGGMLVPPEVLLPLQLCLSCTLPTCTIPACHTPSSNSSRLQLVPKSLSAFRMALTPKTA